MPLKAYVSVCLLCLNVDQQADRQRNRWTQRGQTVETPAFTTEQMAVFFKVHHGSASPRYLRGITRSTFTGRNRNAENMLMRV